MKKISELFLTKIIVIFFLCILFHFHGFAQQTEKVFKVNYETHATANLKMTTAAKNSEAAKEGTYQIIRVLGELEDEVPQSLIDQVESYRTQDQVIYINAGENTFIKILPYNEILASDFKPVAPVIYIEGKLDK